MMTATPGKFGLRPSLEAIAAAIAHSQILVPRLSTRPAVRRRLPEGFEDADLAILDWIAAEGRRAGRAFVRM